MDDTNDCQIAPLRMLPRRGPDPEERAARREKNGTKAAQIVARSLVEDEFYRMSLMDRVKAGRAPHMEVLLWHYAYGKPKETVEHQGDVGIALIRRDIVDAERIA